jgi:hypothetical protein
MTTPEERTYAVLQTREFLVALANTRRIPGISEDIREYAITLLRHYPDAGDMSIAGRACPNWFSAPY